MRLGGEAHLGPFLSVPRSTLSVHFKTKEEPKKIVQHHGYGEVGRTGPPRSWRPKLINQQVDEDA